jgi:hypothetical protein
VFLAAQQLHACQITCATVLPGMHLRNRGHSLPSCGF